MTRVGKEFLDAKEKALKLLEQARGDDNLDESILSILALINKSEHYYTSSSCAGRVVVLEIPRIGDKKNAQHVGKWHWPISLDDLKGSVKKSKKGVLWLLAQSPIFHIGAVTLEHGDKLVKLAVASGFKNSGVKSTGKKIVVEVSSTERLDAPIGNDGILFCDDAYLRLLVDIANSVMEKSALKLQRFETNLRNL